MREVTIKKKVMSLDELAPDVKKEVLEKYRNVEVSHDGWWDPIVEGLKEELVAMGFGGIDIKFILDEEEEQGASFTATTIDLNKYIRAFNIEKQFGILMPVVLSGDLSGNVYREELAMESDLSSIHVHLDAVSINSHERDVTDTLEEFMVAQVRSFCKQIFVRIKMYRDELTSDERIIAYLNENVGEFEENGDIYVDAHLEVSEPE